MLGDALEIIILEGIFGFDIDRKFSFNKLLANFKVFFLLTWYYLHSRDFSIIVYGKLTKSKKIVKV